MGGKPRAKKNVDPHPMKIGGELFLRYRVALAEFKEAKARLSECALRATLEKQKPQYQALLQLVAEHRESETVYGTKTAGLAELGGELAGAIGVHPNNLHLYTINDETGVVLYSPPNN